MVRAADRQPEDLAPGGNRLGHVRLGSEGLSYNDRLANETVIFFLRLAFRGILLYIVSTGSGPLLLINRVFGNTSLPSVTVA